MLNGCMWNAAYYDLMCVCVRLGTIPSSAYDSRCMYFLCSETEYSVSPLNKENEACMFIHLVSG
jgi:hypothetical protein